MKNGKSNNWEARLTRLERKVEQISAMLEANPSKPGWQSLVGVFADDPVFADIRRVTKELIEKERERDKRRFDRARKIKK
jgi:hypothetical protein